MGPAALFETYAQRDTGPGQSMAQSTKPPRSNDLRQGAERARCHAVSSGSHTGPSPSEAHSGPSSARPHTAQGAPMKPTTPDRIRNVALISHGGAGKTSLAEAMLFDAGAISRLGTVEAGTTTLDWDPDEHTAQPEHQPLDRLARARRRAHHPRGYARLRRLPGRRGRGTRRRRRGDRRHRRLGRGRGRHRGGLEAGRCARPPAPRVHQQDGPRERELRRGPGPAQGQVRTEDRARSTCRSGRRRPSAATST